MAITPRHGERCMFARQFKLIANIANIANIAFWQQKSYPQICIQKGNKKGPQQKGSGHMSVLTNPLAKKWVLTNLSS